MIYYNDQLKIELEETKTIHSLLQTVPSMEEVEAARARARAATQRYFDSLQEMGSPPSPPVSPLSSATECSGRGRQGPRQGPAEVEKSMPEGWDTDWNICGEGDQPPPPPPPSSNPPRFQPWAGGDGGVRKEASSSPANCTRSKVGGQTKSVSG